MAADRVKATTHLDFFLSIREKHKSMNWRMRSFDFMLENINTEFSFGSHFAVIKSKVFVRVRMRMHDFQL